MNEKVVASARDTYANVGDAIILGAPVHEGTAHPEPLIRIPLGMLNRHGLIAGATGTGKTRTLQLLAEQLSNAGVPVFVSDIKGDLSGLGAAGEKSDRVSQRSTEVGHDWRGSAFPIEFLSLTGKNGAQVRATVSSFGPLLLAKVLGLNETQKSVLALVFKYCDDHGLALLDFADLRAVLQYLSGDGAAELKEYGGMSKATVGVLLREMVELEQQGAGQFFGEPEFDLDDLMQVERDGKGLISVLSLNDVQDRPAVFSTFMLWMLARLFHELPEVGDAAKPKLVFFFDEAHLLFDDASKDLLAEVEKVARLIRSKGVGIFFVTQSPKDVPADVLGQLGHRVQHALRAFTPDDEKALRAAARTYPKTEFYDVQATLTSLGTGEALVTVLSPKGIPTAPFATRLIAPASRMAPLSPDEYAQRLTSSQQVREYAQPVDRESARELLAKRVEAAVAASESAADAGDAGEGAGGLDAAAGRAPRSSKRTPKEPPTALEAIAKSPLTRTVAGVITRGLMGALLGTPPRRRRRSIF